MLRTLKFWGVVGLLLLIIGIFSIIFLLRKSSGVVAALRLSDGSEYMVTQRYNWSAEPYTVSFYMRTNGGAWGWCYIDHQALRWRDVTIIHDPKTDIITIRERGTWMAALDRKRSTFALGDGKPRREVNAPQSYQNPEFPFP